MKLPISLIILTYNEELNIENCLKSAVNWAEEIIIIDSHSTDKTLEIAKKYTDKIFQHEFKNQAEQFNWALDNLEIKNEWIFKLDADESVTKELWEEISENLDKIPQNVNGFYINRKVFFLGKWIRHGGYYPNWILRIFRKGKGMSEQRKMDEHLVLLEGKICRFKNHIIDNDQKGLTWWTEKHNRYSSREIQELFEGNNINGVIPRFFGSQTERKRWLKESIYSKLSLFCRSFLYFIYRYFIRLGFLDGREGLIFHFLQGFWYRFLVDAKIYERLKLEKK
jgi:glycosyltransferase involved in cell wall biosynthesis